MKKVKILLSTVAFIFCMSACGSNQNSETSEDTTSVSTEPGSGMNDNTGTDTSGMSGTMGTDTSNTGSMDTGTGTGRTDSLQR